MRARGECGVDGINTGARARPPARPPARQCESPATPARHGTRAFRRQPLPSPPQQPHSPGDHAGGSRNHPPSTRREPRFRGAPVENGSVCGLGSPLESAGISRPRSPVEPGHFAPTFSSGCPPRRRRRRRRLLLLRRGGLLARRASQSAPRRRARPAEREWERERERERERKREREREKERERERGREGGRGRGRE